MSPCYLQKRKSETKLPRADIRSTHRQNEFGPITKRNNAGLVVLILAMTKHADHQFSATLSSRGEGLGLLENWLGCTLPESQQEGGLLISTEN